MKGRFGFSGEKAEMVLVNVFFFSMGTRGLLLLSEWGCGSRALKSLREWLRWSFATYSSLSILLGEMPPLMMVDAKVGKVDLPPL